MHPKDRKRQHQGNNKSGQARNSPPPKLPKGEAAASSTQSGSNRGTSEATLTEIRDNLRVVRPKEGETHNSNVVQNQLTLTKVCVFSEGVDFKKVSAIQLARQLRSILTNYKASHTRDGKLLLEIYESEASKIFNTRTICGHPIRVERREGTGEVRTHCWGKIYAPNLYYCSDEEILEEMKLNDNTVELVKRAYRGIDKIKTNLIKIKFNRATLPDGIICVDEEAYPVQPFIPNPTRCWNCKGYGHWGQNCRGAYRCRNCAGAHTEVDCPRPLAKNCVHCGPGHSSLDKNCPRYKKEQQVLEISHERSIPPVQARQLFEAGTRSEAASNRQAFQERPKTFTNPFAKTVGSQTPEVINTEDPSNDVETDVIIYGRSENNRDPVENLHESFILRESPRIVGEMEDIMEGLKGNLNNADRDDLGSAVRNIVDGLNQMDLLMDDLKEVVTVTKNTEIDIDD